MYQQIAWLITIILVTFFGIIFFVLSRKAAHRQEYQPIIEKAYRIRKYYFITLVSIMSIATAISLTQLPYSGHRGMAAPAQDSTKVIEVKGYQYYWELNRNEFVTGERYQFNVTAMDVNHGFGIYDENMVLLAQTQAMPSYTNKLLITFDKPGTYHILCLEYCSVGHHLMMKDIIVKENGGARENG